VRDENDYLAFGCHDVEEHKLQLFTDGKLVEGTWTRVGDGPAQYLDEDGEPIQLKPGKTWVCIVWEEYGEDVVIE